MLIVAKLVAVFVFVAVVTATFYQAAPAEELSFFGNHFPIVAFVLTGLLLIAGIVFGCLFRQISKATTKKINIVQEVRDVFSSPSFWTALCVSPFVLFSVYAVVSAAPGDPASYLLSFQNGFFCESVFRQLMGGQRADSTQQPPPVGSTAG
jgi:hypothetical protein